ncbi:benzoate/H(+) symporter BenE family transporter [Luteolibacter ambystomatis]|uniref:Benzoate/H(+) symporter BenE family transporter n=1 Tax=Luteolibacter ambystomatis TaxID=2824561 RepID=A0A975G7W3_9BACT|nr:benzoate/H(+) symporter BenE family transporter [Luteolibacter ambystomatis]QUE50375.1 benzoate/H(+) symporter BenE family transporter [Luteolibacter ambystomatis]
MRTVFKDFSFSALVAGFVAVLVGFTSSVAVIFTATQNLHATPDQTASWLWAIGIGMGSLSILFSLIWRQPLLIAWSTPGVAVVGAAAAAGNLTLPQAIGTFIASAVLVTLAGFSGGFERVMKRLPLPLASALLAGVLARFALDGFMCVPRNPLLVLTMAAVYVLGRRFQPRACVPLVLATGIAIAAAQGLFPLESVPWKITTPVWMAPEFTMGTILGVAMPLFIVTMASQNLPGVSAIRVGGYEPPVSKVIGWTGITTLLLAPFGCFSVNLAAITAAFCTGPEAHPDPKRRYWAPVCAGVCYLLIGLFGATVAGLFAAFPRELVLAVAGLALLTTIANGLTSALAEERFREASAMTFFVTLSGITLAGIGSAFWGIVAGAVVLALHRKK